MTLATAGRGGTPSARMVLFKGLEDGAFLFYSNYESRKGRDLAENRKAALVFYWSITRHQVRVSGTVRRVSRAASLAYFHSRPRGAQLSALASRQSRVVASRAVLEKAVADLERRYPGDGAAFPPIGAGTRCARRGSSSGRTARTGCTTGSATSACREAVGGSERLAP